MPYKPPIHIKIAIRKPINTSFESFESLKNKDTRIQDNSGNSSSCYLRLPGEIRNKIMQFLVIPGDIFPAAYRLPEHHDICADEPAELVRQSPRRSYEHPEVQILTVNRQLCTEACTLLYGTNNFHIPTGPIEESTVFLSFLRPSHRVQIRHITLRFSIADLTPYVLAQVDKGAWSTADGIPSTPSDQITEVLESLWGVWSAKLAWLLRFQAWLIVAGAPGLETVTVEGRFQTSVLLKGKALLDGIKAAMAQGNPPEPWQIWGQEVRDCAERVGVIWIPTICLRINQDKWPKTKEWLANGIDESMK